MRMARFAGKRLVYFAPQLLAVTLITFWIIRLLPGNPAYGLAGIYATPDVVKLIDARLGLDKPIWVQYVIYLRGLLHGDLGESYLTSQPVTEELLRRVPATLELISIAMFLIIGLGVGLGVLTAVRPGGALERVFAVYGGLSGSLPDFWLGLLLVFFFFFLFHIAPAPFGRLGIADEPPAHVTGIYTVDALVAYDGQAFVAAASHLVLPVLTLVIAYTGSVVKITRATVEEALLSDYCTYARAAGLGSRTVLRYAFRNSLPAILTLVGITYGFLLGGDVLVENVFAWGGVGSYVVASVNRSDYFPIQAFVMLSAVFNLLIYLGIDLVHLRIDPRVEY